MKETMKPVIDALIEGKKTWSDLKALRVQKGEIPDKTLARLLEDLEYWGLAKKDKESHYWIWYERIFRSDQEYVLAIEHSRKLVPALKNMIDVSFKFRDPLYSAAKEHLKSYPEIYRPLGKFEKVFNEENKELLQKYNPELAGSDPFMLISIIPRLESRNPIETRTLLDKLKPFLDLYREFSGRICELQLKIEMGEPLEGMCHLCPRVQILKAE